jgi:hypothetical protein
MHINRKIVPAISQFDLYSQDQKAGQILEWKFHLLASGKKVNSLGNS